MKIYLECYACFLRQALSASRLAGCNEKKQFKVVNQVLKLLQDLEPGITPPEIARRVHGLVKKESNAADPYKKEKDAGTREALSLYPRLKALVDNSDDPMGVALRVSIAGNIIDLGVSDEHDDLWETVERVLSQPYAVNHEKKLRAELKKADHVLFLGDNAGETVFDRVLIEALDVPVIYGVKGFPTLNDATEKDAVAAGIDRSARIIDNGTDAPGTILSLCSENFLKTYHAAPLVIAKGQANYETLSDAGSRVFCLLQVKCPVIAGDIGAPQGGIVIRQSQGPDR